MTDPVMAMGLRPPNARAEHEILQVVVLWVEGRLDRQFWARMVRPESCRVRSAGSWEAVAEQMATVRPGEAVLGVIDADLRHHRGQPAPPRVILTDLANLEVMLLAGDGLPDVLTHVLPDRATEATTLAEAAWEGALFLGRLRLHNEEQGHGLSFKTGRKKDEPLDYRRLCADKDGVVDEAKALNWLWRDLNSRGHPPPDLQSVLRAIPIPDRRLVVNGHDLAGLAALRVRSLDGKRTISGDDLAEMACLRWSVRHLRSTQMGAAVAAWEQQHAPNRLLRVE